MSDSFSKKLSKAVAILASTFGIALGLCGLNAGLFSIRTLSSQVRNLIVMSGVLELVIIVLSLLGLLVVAVIAVVRAVTAGNGRKDGSQ